MSITICFDFGNTRLKAAVFEASTFKEEVVLKDGSVDTMHELVKKFAPKKTILSSVINHSEETEALLKKHSRFHKLGPSTKLPFTTPVGKPETIGADRLALCAAATHLFPGKNNLIISLGTCITYNFINQDHEFLGGAISPGMDMRYRSMHQFTALLPMVEQDEVSLRGNFPLVGYDTKTNLQSGVIAGIGFEIDGYLEYFQGRYDNFNAVLTGGNTLHFARRLKNRIFADQYFIYKGLFALSELNN